MFTIQPLGSILIKVPWMLQTTQSLCVYIQTYAFVIDILLQMIIYMFVLVTLLTVVVTSVT